MVNAQSSGRSSRASRVTLSYRATGGDGEWILADSDWIRDRIQDDTYLKYLKRVHRGDIAVGDEWEEFVNCGCASPQDVIIEVESIEDGDRLDMETDIEIYPRREIVKE